MERGFVLMKKGYVLLIAALALCLCVCAMAEEIRIEVIKVDGMSVVVLLPAETSRQARGAVENSVSLPLYLTAIGEEAFMGIAAETVEVSGNVVSIGPRAFADCPNLRKITIPVTVEKVDDTALAGCADVTVYGAKGSEAERFAKANGFSFIDPDEPETPVVREAAPVALPFVPAD